MDYYGDINHIKQLSEFDANQFRMSAEVDFDELIENILKRLKVHIDTRLGEEVNEDNDKYLAICDIAERICIDILNYAQQMQISDIVERDNIEAYLMDTTDAIQNLRDELEDFKEKKKKVKVTWTGRDKDD